MARPAYRREAELDDPLLRPARPELPLLLEPNIVGPAPLLPDDEGEATALVELAEFAFELREFLELFACVGPLMVDEEIDDPRLSEMLPTDCETAGSVDMLELKLEFKAEVDRAAATDAADKLSFEEAKAPATNDPLFGAIARIC